MGNGILTGVLLTALVAASSIDAEAAEKGKRFNRNKPGREGTAERAVMGDSITFALANDDELKLNAQQIQFLQKMRKTLDAERAKEKEEEEIRELMQRYKQARKQGRAEAPELKQRAQELMEKQAAKWEERTFKELEKALPKELLTKLKDLRGEPEKLAENPFE